MKFVSYVNGRGEERAGLFVQGRTLDLQESAATMLVPLPSTINGLLEGWPRTFEQAQRVQRVFEERGIGSLADPLTTRPLAPVPRPGSCRDGYAFRQHVATARRNRGLEMIPEFDRFPTFYFTNHRGIVGEGEVAVEADHLKQLDFELEAAIVIGARVHNVDAREADACIAGYLVMNDFSARALQMEEMKLNLGPAKGKDFATGLGPWLVTPDEIASHRISTPAGVQHDLAMRAWHNGKQVSEGNLKDMSWTFAQLIERASYGVTLYPGDVIGSGTVGTGCYLELNGTAALEAKASGAPFTPTWLGVGDTIELEIEGLGRLRNKIVRAPGERSLFAKRGTA
jgi:fumarylacetoacetate (FAA) hydrolase